MTSAVVMERAGMGMPGMSTGPAGPMGSTGGMPTAPQWMMVPRCKITMEKCAGGMKMTCQCDDAMSATMLQNLCSMMAGGMCSCCMMMNGMMMCCCNLAMGMCKCEPTKDGVCITCTSGDASCCAMIQACCDCMAAMDQSRVRLLRLYEQYACLLQLLIRLFKRACSRISMSNRSHSGRLRHFQTMCGLFLLG